MIKKVKLINFRNFNEIELTLNENKNFIVGNNGKGKTNILEAISILGGNTISGLNFENLCNKESDFFFIQATNHKNKVISISYDKNTKKKTYIIDKKIVSQKKFKENTYCPVIFSPIIMNIMYLSPSLRRDFLDNILSNSHPEYNKLLKEYKNIVKNRNKLLKNISENKSQKSELFFWNNKLVDSSTIIYKYRFGIVDYISNRINNLKDIFNKKVENISFNYITKIDKNNIRKSIEKYLELNIDRDIILKKTYIGPHVDDFDIILDSFSISNFASRGEMKSIILGLKQIEIDFIENNINKKPILIIDDLLSEIDSEHEKSLINKMDSYQTFISSIKEDDNFDNIIKL